MVGMVGHCSDSARPPGAVNEDGGPLLMWETRVIMMRGKLRDTGRYVQPRQGGVGGGTSGLKSILSAGAIMSQVHSQPGQECKVR